VLLSSLALLGMLSLGYWWIGGRSEAAAERAAREVAEALLDAASDWKRQHAVKGCPSVTQLRADRQLPRGAETDDPWGGRFRITCRNQSVHVRSAGGDRQFSTEDDISIASDWKS
jgi:hypothetical protein